MSKSDTELIRTTIYLPPNLHLLLRELAVKHRTTMSDLIRQAITAWLEENSEKARRK